MPQSGEETNSKLGFYTNLCCGKGIVVPEGSEFPECPNHPGLTTIWKPLVDETIVQLGKTRKPDSAAPRFKVRDPVRFVGAGWNKGHLGCVVGVTEGHVDFVHHYHIQLDDGSLIRCFGFELEGLENESSKTA